MLNAHDFLQSRKYEITELEKAQLNSKFASSTRTFQSLPRTLRRRTASHNVKRIPKRLRKRALREMQTDSGTVKRKSALQGRELYRARTMSALLKLAARLNLQRQLPTTPGKLQLRQRIKELKRQLHDPEQERFNNIIGSYDVTAVNTLAEPPVGKVKYTKRQREYTWLNTHVWHAKRAQMIKRWGWQIPLKPTQKCFRSSHRGFHLDGAIAWDKSYMGSMMIHSDNEMSLVELLNQIMVGKPLNSLKSNGHLMVRMIKTEEIVGEATILTFHDELTKRLIIRAHPAVYKDLFNHICVIKSEDIEVVDNRYSIGSVEITGPVALSSLATILKPMNAKSTQSQVFGQLCCETQLPERTMFTFMAQDPRLANRTKPRPSPNVDTFDVLIKMKADQTNLSQEAINSLLSSEGRTESYKDQHSLKQVAQELNKPREERPKGQGFPVVIYQQQGVWTLLLPWFWTLPVWHALVHIAHVRIGGLKQSHQLKFEQGSLFFPVDYPFTKAGAAENQLNTDVKRELWAKKPVSKRLNYDKVKICSCEDKCAHSKGEIGDPFGCDWRYLQVLRISLPLVKTTAVSRTSAWEDFERKIEELHDVYSLIEDVKASKIPRVSPLAVTLSHDPLPNSIESPLPVTSVKFVTVSRGNMSDNARVYCIPQADLPSWMNTLSTKHITGRKNHDIYPECPSSENLIGFITSGTFNLEEGKNTGVGLLDSSWVLKKEQFVVIRNVGTNAGRLAKWSVIDGHGASP